MLSTTFNAALSAWKSTTTAAQIPTIPRAALSTTADKATHLLTQAAGQAASWAYQNPATLSAYSIAGAGLAVVAAPAIVASPVLAGAGFGAGGIVGGNNNAHRVDVQGAAEE